MTARKVSSILGNSQRLDGGAMFGNAPKALWTRWTEVDEQNRIPLSCRCMLVEEPGRRILFETGIGVFFDPTLRDRFGVVEENHCLLDNLAARGLAPTDIDLLVLSHLHFDHAGGLLSAFDEEAPYSLVFPNADYVIGKEAWDRAMDPHPRDRASFIPELMSLLEDCRKRGKVELVDGDTPLLVSEKLGEGYRFHKSNGHTPGMLLAEVELKGGPLVFAADLIPGTPWVHVPITMGYDRFPEALIDEKKALVEDLESRGGRLFYTHDASTAVSGIAKDERGRFHSVDELSSVEGLAT